MKKLYSALFALVFLMPTLAQAATFHGTRDDFRDETIYFAMTTRFYDGDPKNNVLSWDKQDVQKANNDPDWRGDFAGLIEKLDYIKALGFTAIWITPIVQNASGEDYHGYHAMDFSNVDLRYESRKEWGCDKDVKFQDLIDAAHKKGIKIVLDIVLNHTSNFGEAKLNPLFTRNQNIRNQATPAGALIPNTERLSNNYFGQTGQAQYAERFKFFKNPQYDTHNMYHHYGTGWNWDLPNRWWGQIAGDCVDLNTENDAVAQYLVDCYGKFIEMGVDGFRIDTTGHIARLTFNTQFIPQFQKLFEKHKDKRVDGSAYFMFGECCARFGGVIYRDQHNLSSHFYTWKSDQSLMDKFKSHSSQSWWDTQKLNEGHDTPVGPMVDCESETSFNKNSSNVFMQNNAWHTPDYSEYSGFSVIDFPIHYNFNNAGSAINIAKEGDKYYNDASYNVVYVDSHDYCPGPNDGTRFNGGTEQWAENLSLMFTFRGIPCIYYGSEVEFKKGMPIDVGGENNKTPRAQSGRAYFGEYLEGNVTASDFGVYKADGNVATTLDGDLAHHIRRLNMIRAAVPALRKGQYTFDGCSGSISFKRAYNKNGEDSYALVAINGGATFSNLPAGTYVDVVTGQSYTATQGGSITVNAPANKGQLRVLVKGWKEGKIGEDGKFMYSTSSVAHKGNPTFADKGTTSYYTADDVVGNAALTFSPAGGSFKTDTQKVTVKLNEAAESGWFKVGNGQQQNVGKNETKTFTIGEGMSYGETVSVTWSASAGSETYTGTVTYKKVDPNAVINIYVKATSAPYLYAWLPGTETALNGSWPGNRLTQQIEQGGEKFYHIDFDQEAVNIILSDDKGKSEDITGITSDTFIQYNGGSSYSIIQAPVATPKVTLSPNGGTFKSETQSVTAALNNVATSGWYKIGDGAQVEISKNSPATFIIGEGMNFGDKVVVSWSATDGSTTNAGSATFTKAEPSTGITVYVQASNAPHLYVWNNSGDLNGAWPGNVMSEKTSVDGTEYWCQSFNEETINVIFNNGSGGDNNQTADIKGLTGDSYFTYNGGSGYTTVSSTTGSGSQGGQDETSKPEGDFIVYFDNSNSLWGTPYIHYWGSSESKWPGETMSLLSGNLWYYNLPSGTTGIVFNNGEGTQTNDLSAIANHVYTVNGDNGEYNGPGNDGNGNGGEADNPETSNDWHVYFDNSSSNWPEVYVYVWKGNEPLVAWPGTKITNIHEETGYHHHIFESGKDLTGYNIIFSDGKGKNEGGYQTDDLELVNNAVYNVSGNTGQKVTGIGSVTEDAVKANVWSSQGRIFVELPEDMDVYVVRIDGRYHVERMKAGVNVIEGLPHGLYIVNGVKVMI